MSIVFEKGDLFEVTSDVIAHGANCRGVMGAGIAKQFRRRFPSMYSEYASDCYSGKYIPGDFMPFAERDAVTNNEVVGINLFTQDNPGADATAEAVYISLVGGSQRMRRAYSHRDPLTTLAMPLIGCGIGGLTFPEFFAKVYAVAQIFKEIEYKIVYNDSNEDLIPESILTAQWA